MKKDSYLEDILKKCDVCRQDVNVDQYGNGECHHCGWKQNSYAQDSPDRVMYPNLVSFNKAKLLYKQGKKFNPTLEDFVEGLFFYSEMEFYYNTRRYAVLLKTNTLIIIFYEYYNENSLQEYKTKEEFIAKAHINGTLLSDIWNVVEKINYMSCE